MTQPCITSFLADWDLLTTDAIVRPQIWVSIEFGTNTFFEHTFTNRPVETTLFDRSNGVIQSVTFPRQNINREKQTFTIVLSGLDESLLGDAMRARQDYSWPNLGSDIPRGVISLRFIGENDFGNDAEFIVASGLLESTDIVETSSEVIVSMTFAQSSDWLWDRPIEGRYTDVYQQSLKSQAGDSFFGDKGFEFVEKLQDWELFWAKPKPAKKKGKKKKGKKNRGKGKGK